MDRRKRRRFLSALQSGILEDIRSISNTSLASFTGDGRDLVRLVVGIEPVQSGSGDPAPDNVRPITGWMECKVTRTGENIAPSDKWQAGMLTNSGQTFSALYGQRTMFLPCEPNTSYILKISEEKNIRLFGYVTDQSNPNATTVGTAVLGKEASIITGANDAFIRACVWDTDTSVTLNFSDFSPVVLAKDAQVYTVDLDGTRYGGTLDVTTGKLTVTHKLGAMPSDMTYQTNAAWKVGSWYANVFPDGKSISGYSTVVDMWCDRATVETPANIVSASSAVVCGIGWGGSGTQLYFNFGSQYDTLAKIQTYLSENSVQVVYPLDTPIEVQLTPAQIATLSEVNNIWADTGDIILLEYMA